MLLTACQDINIPLATSRDKSLVMTLTTLGTWRLAKTPICHEQLVMTYLCPLPFC